MGSIRRLTWLLMGLLISVAFYSFRPQPEPVIYVHASQPTLPDIIAPEGVFAEVFDEARPATLRIEARSPLMQGRPIGVGTGFLSRQMALFLRRITWSIRVVAAV